MISRNNRALLLYYVKLCASFQIHRWIQTGVTVWKRSIRVEIGDILSCVTLKFDGRPWKTIGHLFYTTSGFCASFQIHRWSQTWVIVRKRSIWVKIGDFLSCVTLKFHGWPWKTTGHHSFTTLSFVHHFKAMGEFKLEFQSGNAQFGSKAAIFCPVWPWNLTDGPENNRALLLCYFRLCASFQSHSVNSNWSYSPETPNLDQNQRYF